MRRNYLINLDIFVKLRIQCVSGISSYCDLVTVKLLNLSHTFYMNIYVIFVFKPLNHPHGVYPLEKATYEHFYYHDWSRSFMPVTSGKFLYL
jgi:hypothetical protein